VGEKVTAKVLKGMEVSPTTKTIRLAQLSTGQKLPLTLGAGILPGKKIKARDLFKFQVLNNITDTATKNIATFINQFVKHGTIEEGFQQKLREMYSAAADFYTKEIVEFFNEETGEMERFPCTNVKDLSQFALFIIAERGLDIHKTEAVLNLDKGGDVLKLTLQILQEEEVEGEPLSSGVNKAIPVCCIPKPIKESSLVLGFMYRKINAKDVKHKNADDFKVDTMMCGIQPHGSSYPCYLCKAHGRDFETTFYPTRTVRSLFEDHAAFKLWCVGKSKTAIEMGAKDFFNVAYLPVIFKPTTEEELNQPTRHVVAIDELHLLTGIFKDIYYGCKVHFPTMDRWPKQCGCHSQGYHGGVFTGGDSTLMLEQVGILENMARDEWNFTAF
jgi:hypothetical protein